MENLAFNAYKNKNLALLYKPFINKNIRIK